MNTTVSRPQIFVSNRCPSCRALDGNPLLSKAQVRNIDIDPDARDDLSRAGLSAIPSLVHGDEKHVGVKSILEYLQTA